MIVLNEAQLNAVSKMHNGCILCGRVGSGKSRTALAYYYKTIGGKLTDISSLAPIPHADRGEIVPLDLYIITTAKKRDTLEWDNEMAAFMLSQNPEA